MSQYEQEGVFERSVRFRFFEIKGGQKNLAPGRRVLSKIQLRPELNHPRRNPLHARANHRGDEHRQHRDAQHPPSVVRAPVRNARRAAVHSILLRVGAWLRSEDSTEKM